MPCIDRNDRARLLFRAEALDRHTRRPGQHGGVLKRTGLAVLKTLLFRFAHLGSGRCDPSFDTLARVAGVCRSTVAKALARLEAAGLLARVRRQAGPVRYTNAYVFAWSEFRPETTTNKKTKPYSELSTGGKVIPRRPAAAPASDPTADMSVAEARRALAVAREVFARQRAEREARERAAREQTERELHEAQRAAGWTRRLVLPPR